MGEILEYFKNKKNLVGLLILGLLILGIPLGVSLVRLQQIIKSRATADPIVFTGPNVRQKADGTWVATKPQIQLQITSPLGNPAPVQSSSQTVQSKNSQTGSLSKGLVGTVYADGVSDCDSHGGLASTIDNCDPAIGKKVQVFVCKDNTRLSGSVTETSCSSSSSGGENKGL